MAFYEKKKANKQTKKTKTKKTNTSLYGMKNNPIKFESGSLAIEPCEIIKGHKGLQSWENTCFHIFVNHVSFVGWVSFTFI